MVREITENFVPVRVKVREDPDTFHRFGGQWTPTILVLDPDGTERYRIEGFLPVDDFLAQLELGLAKRDFAHERWPDAERRFREVCQVRPSTSAAAEACYWAGVSSYKATNKPEPLGETAQLLRDRFPQSEWTKKASVWLH